MSSSNGGKGPRTVALVGPYGSGKTTLLESILLSRNPYPAKARSRRRIRLAIPPRSAGAPDECRDQLRNGAVSE